MYKIKLFTNTVSGFYLLLLAGTAQAVLNIEITQGVEGAVPLAVVSFAWQVPPQNPQTPAELLPPKNRRLI